MKAITFLIAITMSLPVLAKTCKSGSTDPKAVLSAIYTAQMATHAEKKKYGETFKDIGFNAEKAFGCDNKNWEVELLADQDGKGFHAYVDSKVTGETWTVDDKKLIEQL